MVFFPYRHTATVGLELPDAVEASLEHLLGPGFVVGSVHALVLHPEPPLNASDLDRVLAADWAYWHAARYAAPAPGVWLPMHAAAPSLLRREAPEFVPGVTCTHVHPHACMSTYVHA